MHSSNCIAIAALAATLGFWGVSADALKLTFGPGGTSSNGTPIPVSGEVLFSFAADSTLADGSLSGGDLRIDVTVTNTTLTDASSITQSFITGFGFDVLGVFKGADVGTKLDNVNTPGSFPGNTTVDLGACTATSCTGLGQPDGIANGNSDFFSVYTLGGTTIAEAEQDYFKLFADGQPFSTGSGSDPTSVMRWRGIEGPEAAGGSETKINPTVVPLPAAVWLLAAVFGGLGAAARYKKKVATA